MGTEVSYKFLFKGNDDKLHESIAIIRKEIENNENMIIKEYDSVKPRIGDGWLPYKVDEFNNKDIKKIGFIIHFGYMKKPRYIYSCPFPPDDVYFALYNVGFRIWMSDLGFSRVANIGEDPTNNIDKLKKLFKIFEKYGIEVISGW